MGLDQYAYISQQSLSADSDQEVEHEETFYWRKHAKLQKYMEDLWEADHPDGPEFNCVYLELSEENLLDLQRKLKGNEMPESEGGFFFGHQFQDESADEYREQDLEFCERGLDAISRGLHVTYSCWW